MIQTSRHTHKKERAEKEQRTISLAQDETATAENARSSVAVVVVQQEGACRMSLKCYRKAHVACR
jgi:hypothetical protein